MVTVVICCAAVALGLVVVYGWKFLCWSWFKPRRLEKALRQQGFNGNSYKFLYGDMKEMRATTIEAISKPMNFSNDIVHRVLPAYHKALNIYGEKFFMWSGSSPTIPVSDPEIIREIFSKNYVFQKPDNQFFRLVAGGVGSLETDKWAKHRKIISPAFHLEKLKHMVPSFYLSCADMLSKWDDKIVASSDGSFELDVWPCLKTLTCDAISRTAFGSSYEEGRKIFQLQIQQIQKIMEASSYTKIPGYRFLPTKFNTRMKEMTKEIESTLLGIINKRIKAMEEEAGINVMNNQDLLGLLLESNKEIKHNQGNESAGMSMKEVIEECKVFYVAGQETTASLLVWTMILLSKHEDWQVRARDEVLHVFGRDNKPADYKQLNQLKIVSMILYEVLRLYPPVLIISRNSDNEEHTFGNKLSLPAGVQLMVPIISMHRDPKIWGDDAQEFKPERFGEGVSKATQGKLAYFPFGGGPRVCIGQNFAMLEAKMTLAMILQHYSFHLSPSYSHAPRMVMTLKPQHGAHLVLTKLH